MISSPSTITDKAASVTAHDKAVIMLDSGDHQEQGLHSHLESALLQDCSWTQIFFFCQTKHGPYRPTLFFITCDIDGVYSMADRAITETSDRGQAHGRRATSIQWIPTR